MTLRTLVVGCGHIAQQHFAALAAIRTHSTTWACDLSPALARSSHERFGLAGWTTDFQNALDSYRPEIVHIATPASTHVPLSIAALNHGAHVFVEKPIAPSCHELRELQSHAASVNRIVIEDHNYRFNEPVARLLRWTDEGRLGTIRHLQIFMALDILGKGSAFVDPYLPHPSVKMPGGAVSDFMSHFAYLTNVFMGEHREVQTVWQKNS